jgi:transcriptional regulator with XRE-family HTH domain
MTKDELTAWREKQGLSQNQLAQLLGVASTTINRWERGEREIPAYLHLALKSIPKTKGKKKKKKVVRK